MLKILTKYKYLVLATFVLSSIAIGLRLYKFGEIPTSLYWDEMAMYVDLKALVATGNDMHGRPWYQLIFPSYGDYKLPVYLWFATVTAKILGVSFFSLRLPSAIGGLATIVVTFFIAQQLAKKETTNRNKIYLGLTTAMTVAFSVWSITFSRTAFEGHLAQMFLGLAVLMLFFTRKKYRFHLLSIFFAALATYTYFSVRFVWPLIYILFSVVFATDFLQQFSLKKVVTYVFYATVPLLIYIISLIPMYQADFYSEMNTYRYSTNSILNSDLHIQQSSEFRVIAGDTLLDKIAFHRYLIQGRELLKNISDNLDPYYVFFSGDVNLRHGTQYFGLFLPLWLIFFLIGIYNLFYKNWRYLVFTLGWWLAALLPASFPQETPHALRSLNGLIPLSLLIGYGIYQVTRYYQLSKESIVKYAVASIFVLLLMIETLFFNYHYFAVYPDLSKSSWHTEYAEWSREIMAMRTGKGKTIIVTPEDKFYLWFMGLGYYNGSEFHTWPSENFKFLEFDNIIFGDIYAIYRNAADLDVIAGRPRIINEVQENMNLEFSEVRTMYIRDTGEEFIIAKIK